jgi:class 3 adenylate cyclase
VIGVPETKFAVLGEDRIAYQVLGQGPPDLLWMSSVAECIDLRWEYPPFASFLQTLASFSRLIMFDRRGAGASDPVSLEQLPTWEEWSDDALAILDAVESKQATVLGVADGGPVAALFAASHPARVSALILGNAWARMARSEDYPLGVAESRLNAILDLIAAHWGTESFADLGFYPDSRRGPEFRRYLAKSGRLSCSPREAVTYNREINRIDVRGVLPSIRVPTLVLHRKDSPVIELGRYLADHLSDARFVVVPGEEFTLYTEPSSEIMEHLEAFLTGVSPSRKPDRALATILFTDIVASTERASALGDPAWRNLLKSHDSVTRTVVEQYRGHLVKTTGDGLLATFDGPGRAIRCAMALIDALRPIGLEIRAGLHTGEVELMGDDIAGIGVHIAARVLEAAGTGELLVSAAVPMLVTGSGIKFEDRGEHQLKGVPEPWRLFVVQD